MASNDGNISCRLDDTRIITTPKSVSKGFMTPDMMVIVDYDGKKVSGDREASTELPMHLEVYRNRPDANAVCHAHPPLATGFAVAGIPLTKAVLAEVITTLGSIPIAAYGTPSTAELPDAVRQYIEILMPITVEEGDKRASLLPADRFEVAFEIAFASKAIGRQAVDLVVDEDAFQIGRAHV